MPQLISGPTIIPSVGTKPKVIREYVGGVNTQETALSIAHMTSPGGWLEPGQRPEFAEYTLVLSGMLLVETEGGSLEVRAGQAVRVEADEWVRYSTPTPEGADYIAVCLPAFSPTTVHRDDPPLE